MKATPKGRLSKERLQRKSNDMTCTEHVGHKTTAKKFSGISYSKVNFKKVNYTRHMLKTVIYRAYLFEIVALNISNLIINLPNACT